MRDECDLPPAKIVCHLRDGSDPIRSGGTEVDRERLGDVGRRVGREVRDVKGRADGADRVVQGRKGASKDGDHAETKRISYQNDLSKSLVFL